VREEDWRVLPPGFDWGAAALEQSIRLGHALSGARRGRRPDAATRRRLMEALGLWPLPKRTPLRAKVTGRARRDGYRIENVIFESRPRFYVTANLYLPAKQRGRAPVVLVPVGHWMEEGKNHSSVQACCATLARMGYVAFTYDPIGQGERLMTGNEHINGLCSLLTGHTIAGHMVWDSIRAIDYLEARPEVDPSRIGVTGCSGGGLNTLYLAPVDQRVKAAVSACFVCSYAWFLECRQEHCICNHIPAVLQFAEEWDVVGLARPSPFLCLNGLQDSIFPIVGTRETLREARRIFGGRSDRVRSLEFDTGHGYDQPMREAMYGWFDRWLRKRGDGQPIPEAPFEAEPPTARDLLALKGKKMPRQSETLASLNRKAVRKPARASPDALRETLLQLLGAPDPGQAPRVEDRGGFEGDRVRVWRGICYSEPGIPVPFVLLEQPGGTRSEDLLVYISDDGKLAASRDTAAQAALKAGRAVLALDLRGFGETAHKEYLIATNCILLGRPLLGRRVFDLLAVLKAIRLVLRPSRVSLLARGHNCALVAWFACALEDSIARVACLGGLASYADVSDCPSKTPPGIFVPGLLKHFDLRDLAPLVRGRLTVFGPVDRSGKKLTAPAARAGLGREIPVVVASADKALAKWTGQ